MRMKEYESKGDSFIHEIIMELNKAFITPIEREDILQLAMSMDDVLDGLITVLVCSKCILLQKLMNT